MNREILRLAVPNIIANLTVPLLGMVDLFIVGHLSSESYIGAIAVAATIFNFIYWNFSFLRMGTSGFTAQAYGAGDRTEAGRVLLRSLAVAAGAAAILLILQQPILRTALAIVKTEGDTGDYVARYFGIYIWSVPAVLCFYACNGWFIGMQDARTPMFLSIGINLVNILTSLLLVFYFNMEIEGVALGSLFAQYCGAAACLVAIRRKYPGSLPMNVRRTDFNRDRFRPFFRVNRDIYLRTLCLIAVTTFFTSASARFGETTLSVNTLMMHTFFLFSYVMDGFAHAAEALTGRFAGAGRPDKLRSLIRTLFGWGFGLAAIFTIGYCFLSEDLFRFLTDKEAILTRITPYLFWIFLIPLAGFAAFLWDGIYIGLTRSRARRNSMFAAMVVFFLLYYSLEPRWGNHGLWTAFIGYLAARGILQTLLYRGADTARREE